MAMEQSDRTGEIQRRYITPRYLDPAQDPPAYEDFKFPTTSVTFRGPIRRGPVRAPRGSILGSYYLGGSHYDFAKGTYSLRITRRQVFSGSRNQRWMIRHSRAGTLDVVDFVTAGRDVVFGNQLEPVYTVGPGTLVWGFIGANETGSMGSAYYVSQFMEGIRNA